MGIELNSNFAISKVLPKITFGNVSHVTLPQEKRDSFGSNSGINKYFDESQIKNMINSNPNVTKILKKHNLSTNINMSVLKNLSENHLNSTKSVAMGIYEELPVEIKAKVNKTALADAAALHDYGKVLIPESVLNKKESLTKEETEIVKLHSELGYELLQTQNINPQTLKLIKYHHQNKLNTGYPQINDLYSDDETSQILHAADIYSALREPRPYKNSMSKEQALYIMGMDVAAGTVDKAIYDALKTYAEKENSI